MKVKLISSVSGRSVEMPDKVFGKLLHLARIHRWQSEKADQDWPQGSWNTEVILCHVWPYLPGSVSEQDARDLASALRRCLVAESSGMEESLYLKAMMLCELAKLGGFEVEVVAEQASAPRLSASAISFLC